MVLAETKVFIQVLRNYISKCEVLETVHVRFVVTFPNVAEYAGSKFIGTFG